MGHLQKFQQLQKLQIDCKLQQLQSRVVSLQKFQKGYVDESGYDSDDSNASFATAISHASYDIQDSKDEGAVRLIVEEDGDLVIRIARPKKTLQRLEELGCLGFLPACIPCMPPALWLLPRATGGRAATTSAAADPQKGKTAPGQPSAATQPTVTTVTGGCQLETTDLGWATCIVEHGEAPDSMRNVRVVAKDSTFTEEAVSDTCTFIRKLLTTTSWPYNLTYDFRNMRVPTVSFVVQFARLGSEPEILKISQERCSTCKVILLPGMKFTMLKATISTFFKVMPPVCRTYLLTEDGEPSPDAVYFEPPKA